MRSLTICFVLLWMTPLAAPALAVTPTTGDIFKQTSSQIIHWDAETGGVTTVSCWNMSSCTPIGSGPAPDGVLSGNLAIGPDGFLYTMGTRDVLRINPENGDREFATTGLPSGVTFAIYPLPWAIRAVFRYPELEVSRPSVNRALPTKIM